MNLYFHRRRSDGLYRWAHPFAGSVWRKKPPIDQADRNIDDARRSYVNLSRHYDDLEIVEFEVVEKGVVNNV
jgi:hypothetical protein